MAELSGAVPPGACGWKRIFQNYTMNDTGLSVKQVKIKADKGIVRRRKSIVEHPLETIKRGMDTGYCLTCGLRTVTGEFSLTFPACNLKLVINIPDCQKLMESLTGQVPLRPWITR
jgi:hypothetical protein